MTVAQMRLLSKSYRPITYFIPLAEGISTGPDSSLYIFPVMVLQSKETRLVQLYSFMSCSTISYARIFSSRVVVGNRVNDDVGDGVAGVVVDSFGGGDL